MRKIEKKRGTAVFLSISLLLMIPLWGPDVLWAADDSRVRGQLTLSEELTVTHRLPPSAAPDDHSWFAVTVSGDPLVIHSRKEVTFQICIRDSQVLLGDTSYRLSYTQDMDLTSQYVKTDCTPIHHSPDTRIDIRRPGSWTQDRWKIAHVFLPPDKAKEKYKVEIIPRLKFIPFKVEKGKGSSPQVKGGLAKGEYKVEVSTGYLQAPVGYMEHKVHNICQGTETQNVSQIFAGDFGKPPAQGQVERLGNLTRISSSAPFKTVNFSGGWKLDYDPKGSQGTATLEDDRKENKEAVYEKKVSAHWSFQPADLCQDLAYAINHDLAYAKAYQDPVTRSRPLNRYKCHVDRYAYHELFGRWPTEPQLQCDQDLPEGAEAQGAGDEIGVNSQCQLENKEPYLEKAKRSCVPEEVVHGVLVHENVHVGQCQRDPDLFNGNSTEIWGEMEVTAHLAGIADMLKSLKQHCPQYPTADFERRIKDIEDYHLKR